MSESKRRFRRTQPLPQRCALAPLALSLRAATERSRYIQARLDGAVGEYRALCQAELRAALRVKAQAEARFFEGTRAFLHKQIRRFEGDDVDSDDLFSEAQQAAWSAALRWRPDGGAPFDTWARYAIRGALQKTLLRSRVVKGSQRGEVVSLCSDLGPWCGELPFKAEDWG